MFFHLIHYAVQILEEFYMAQLIQFIMADDLEVHVLLCLFEVCLRRNESCNSGSRIAYFRGGYELIDHIRISGFLALLDDVQQVILSVIIQVMDDIRVIPENTEIFCCRFQVCESSDGLIGVGVALRVGVFRYTPDSLDGVIFCNEFFYHVHVRSFRRHRNIDHLNAEVLGYTEVTVIARYRTEEFYFVQLVPRSAACNALQERTCYGIKHNGKAGVSVNDDVFRRNLTDISDQFSCFRNTGQHAVVPAVGSIFCEGVFIFRENGKHSFREI